MDELVLWPPSWSMLLLLPALFVGFTVHELGHAVVAYLLGDTSQVERRRLSFNPLRHVSWVGLVVFLVFGFGWAKPVRVEANRFRVGNQAFGMFLVSIAGASANLVAGLIALAGMILTASIVWAAAGASPVHVLEFLMVPGPGLDAQGIAVALSGNMLKVNLLLAFFNLLPLPPLDGFHAAASLVAAIRTGRDRRTEPGQGQGLAWPVSMPAEPAASREAEDEPSGDEVAAISPARIHFDIGLEYQRSGQLDEAIARYRQATAHDEEFGLAYYNLGLAYWEKGRIPLAISAFRAARACPSPAVQIRANRHLREFAFAEQNPDLEPRPVPSPLEPQDLVAQAVDMPAPVDPVVTRRVWLSLATSGLVAVMLTAAGWFYVLSVTLGALGGMTPP